ncbi:hypothetical protein LOK49_LG12G02385 [Camellia lanceoleosa]|uniref:Uncharacterized protein n=1 Tax=Camellia lanceoleosa TaxID=1840588 RepID=A0ACC0FWZ5_9ERIC|nr:hypothetical protein LOK49_LG12G02385 [Camellia lanceoleosa]
MYLCNCVYACVSIYLDFPSMHPICAWFVGFVGLCGILDICLCMQADSFLDSLSGYLLIIVVEVCGFNVLGEIAN